MLGSDGENPGTGRLNPYAPTPETVAPRWEGFQEADLWCDGQSLMIRSGAVLPARCFVTGQPTNRSVSVQQYWQPKWLYLLLLPGLIPYFLFSPWLRRRVTLNVPVSDLVYDSHLRTVRLGEMMLSASILLLIVWVFTFGFLFASRMFLMVAAICGTMGFSLASRQVIALQIASLRGDLLQLHGVHPEVLEQVASSSDRF